MHTAAVLVYQGCILPLQEFTLQHKFHFACSGEMQPSVILLQLPLQETEHQDSSLIPVFRDSDPESVMLFMMEYQTLFLSLSGL